MLVNPRALHLGSIIRYRYRESTEKILLDFKLLYNFTRNTFYLIFLIACLEWNKKCFFSNVINIKSRLINFFPNIICYYNTSAVKF